MEEGRKGKREQTRNQVVAKKAVMMSGPGKGVDLEQQTRNSSKAFQKLRYITD